MPIILRIHNTRMSDSFCGKLELMIIDSVETEGLERLKCSD